MNKFARWIFVALVVYVPEVPASELLIPLVSKHTSYHGKKINNLNEHNFGIGYEGDRGYFGVMFKDSMHNPSAVLGRNFRKQVELADGWHISGTLSAGLMFRQNVKDYAPFPVVMPFVGVGRYRWTAELTYIPATRFTEQGAAFLMLRKSL